MTRNYDVNDPGGKNNPLYNKLRKRFSYGGKTIADVVVMRAIQDGYNPRAVRTPPTAHKPQRHTTSEISLKRANSIIDEGRTAVFDKTVHCPEDANTIAATALVKRPADAAQKTGAERKHTGRPLNLGFVAMLLLCFGLLMYLVYAGMQINELNQEISSLRTENSVLAESRTYYEEQLAKKDDIDVILGIATDELGMVKRSEVAHVVIGEGGGDVVEVYEETEEGGTFISNLLNAFTESFGK